MTGFDQSDGKCGTGDATDAGESVAHADARASNGGRVDLAGEEFQKCTLTRTIRTYQGYVLSTLYFQIKPSVKHLSFMIPLLDLL